MCPYQVCKVWRVSAKRCWRSWLHILTLKTPTRPTDIHYSTSRMHFVQPGQKWLSSTTCKFFEKCPNTSKKSHAHLQCVHDNCASFEECQLKGVGGVDYKKYPIKDARPPPFYTLDALCPVKNGWPRELSLRPLPPFYRLCPWLEHDLDSYVHGRTRVWLIKWNKIAQNTSMIRSGMMCFIPIVRAFLAHRFWLDCSIYLI
jgi:hypothetical protein